MTTTPGSDPTPTEHLHAWVWNQNVTTSGFAMPPYEACACGAARTVIPAERAADPTPTECVRDPDIFNEHYPVGTGVLAFPGSRDGRAILTTTRSSAWCVGNEPVVMVEGYSGGIALTHIEVVPAERAADPTQTGPCEPRCHAYGIGCQCRPAKRAADARPVADVLAAHGLDLVGPITGSWRCACGATSTNGTIKGGNLTTFPARCAEYDSHLAAVLAESEQTRTEVAVREALEQIAADLPWTYNQSAGLPDHAERLARWIRTRIVRDSQRPETS